ncbi:MAG: hypothetical protein NTZ78_01270, partial [Candidatus Aureabacteria bacterium]|nr:hypothetical protein [Candidatus Auribacterota bacterium]
LPLGVIGGYICTLLTSSLNCAKTIKLILLIFLNLTGKGVRSIFPFPIDVKIAFDARVFAVYTIFRICSPSD